jgi:hypothetical protein
MRNRRTVVVVLTVITASLFGLSLAVVAFGQSSDPTSDYTVPLGDYTQTTPATPTTPTPTLPSAGVPSGGKTTSPHTSRGTTPAATPTSAPAPAPTPAKATRRVTTLAFTGAEPVLIGLGGASLMLLGFALHLRRRSGRSEA